MKSRSTSGSIGGGVATATGRLRSFRSLMQGVYYVALPEGDRMRRTLLGLTIASLAAIALASTSTTLSAQAAAPQGGRAGGAPRPEPPAPPLGHTPDGQPDIQGYWSEKPGGPEAV